MKILISPTKTMKTAVSSEGVPGKPIFLEKTSSIIQAVQALSYEEAKKLWNCNDALARLNFDRFQSMNVLQNTVPAVSLYDGLQFKYMRAETMSEEEKKYLNDHLRILSGLYGILSPYDGIVPYRLEMQSKISVDGASSLYDFWGKDLYTASMDGDHTIIQLASKEYAKCVERYAGKEDHMIAVDFLTWQHGTLRQQSTYAKMGRGDMVRFLAVQKAESPEVMKAYKGLGFHFDSEKSDEGRYVFIKSAGA